MKKQWILYCAVVCALGGLACDDDVHYHVLVTNERDIPVIVRAGTTETLFEEHLQPGKSLELDLVNLNASLRAEYFVSVEPDAGPDVRSFYVSFARADVKHNSETNPIRINVGSEQSRIDGMELLNIVDGVVVANDTVDKLQVNGSVEFSVEPGERVGAMLDERNAPKLSFGNYAVLHMRVERNEALSFGAPLGVRQGTEGTSVVIAYYFDEAWFRPELTASGVGHPSSPTGRNDRTREVADLVEKHYRDNGSLPNQGALVLPDFAIDGEDYEWEKGCFLETRESESDDWFHFRVYQKDKGRLAYWLCRSVYIK